MSDASYRTRDRRVLRWLLLGLLLIFGAIYASLVYYTGARIPRTASVDGVRIGGLPPAAAERRLADGLAVRAARPVVVSADGERATLRPEHVGFTVDTAASVAGVRQQPSWDPRRLWEWFAVGRQRPAVVRVDEPALRRVVGTFAERVDDPVVEGAVTFAHGKATARYPEAGTALDRDAATLAVRRAFLHQPPDQVLRLHTAPVLPRLTKDAVSQAMDRFANPAVSAPVMIRVAGEEVRVDPADYTGALAMRVAGTGMRPRLDADRLVRLLRPRTRSLTQGPRDAAVRVVAGRPRVVPGRAGVRFHPRDLTRGFLGVLTKTGERRTLRVRGVRDAPDVTTAEVRRLRITERVSTFATQFPYAPYRNVNIPRAAGLVNGTLLRPGETFSLNRTVGERTAANGFAKGYIISDGVYRKDYGGGVSQVATTTFNAAFFAGLRDVEHKPHSFYISRYPVGREATVAWPDVDLRFTNTTPYGVLLTASVEKATPSRQGTVRVSMWSTRHWDIRAETSARYAATPPGVRRLTGAGCVPNSGYAGFAVDVYRLFYRPGSSQLVGRERMHTTYTPSDTVVCS